MFDALEVAGREIGILSNADVMHWRRLSGLHGGSAEYQLARRAAHAHASFILKRAKPDSQIDDAFARAAAASL